MSDTIGVLLALLLTMAIWAGSVAWFVVLPTIGFLWSMGWLQ